MKIDKAAGELDPNTPGETPERLHRQLLTAMERQDRARKEGSAEQKEEARRAVLEAMSALDATGHDPMEASVAHGLGYSLRMHDGLLRRSVSQDWWSAVKEWHYDRGYGYSLYPLTCELCGCSSVRYWFDLINRVNGKGMRIGSECVQNWCSPGLMTAIAYDKKRMVSAVARQKRLDELHLAAQVSPWVRRHLADFKAGIERYGKLRKGAAKIVKEQAEQARAQGLEGGAA